MKKQILTRAEKQMMAYHGSEQIKTDRMTQVLGHRLADELIKGMYWQRGKGCAVGCTVHSGSHAAYETELGIPEALAKIEDGIFEGLPSDLAMLWPEQFLEAIPVGADLSMVTSQFLHWLLVDPVDGVIRFAKTEITKTAIENVGKLYARRLAGDEPTKKEWSAAAAAAAAAADAADYADADAADAAYAAAYAADYAAAYAAAAADAKQNARVKQSQKLLELLRAAPVPIEA